MAETAFQETYDRLRRVVEPYVETAVVVSDEPGSIYLEKPGAAKAEMLAAVSIKKAYVSFHYWPVYVQPSLVEQLSPELKKRMQGKSCFNFKRPDDPAIDELEQLVTDTAADFLAS